MAKPAKREEQTSFEDILKMPSSSFDRPKNVPPGTYLAMVRGLPEHGVIPSGTPFSKYTWQLLSAEDDVDEDALNACLTKADGTVVPLHDKSIQQTMWNTPEAAWRHRELLNTLKAGEEDDLFEERIDQAPGKQAFIHIKHSPAKSGDAMYANVDKVIPVAED